MAELESRLNQEYVKYGESGLIIPEGSIVIPQPPSMKDLSGLELAAGIGAVALASSARFGRNRFFKFAAFAGSIAMAESLPTRVAEAEGNPRIVPVEYERSLGRHKSFPWLPLDGSIEGDEATGFNKGGPWDKYDALDRALNGYRARSVYWRPTRDWLIDVAWHALYDGGYQNYLNIRSWSGYCMDAGAASYFAPKIEGPITVIVGNQKFEFSESDRQVIGTMRWGGLARRSLDPGSKEFADRVDNGEAVVVNHSGYSYMDWWGYGKKRKPNGKLDIVRSRVWTQAGLLVEIEKYPEELWGAYLLDDSQPQPGYEGNFAVVDRQVGGLILGTHQLIA